MTNLDDEFAKMIAGDGGEEAEQEMSDGLGLMAARLGVLMVALVGEGFSKKAAESIAQDWFNHLACHFVATLGDEDPDED